MRNKCSWFSEAALFFCSTVTGDAFLIHVAETNVGKSERAGAIDCHVTYSCTTDAVRLKTLSRNLIFTLSVIEVY